MPTKKPPTRPASRKPRPARAGKKPVVASNGATAPLTLLDLPIPEGDLGRVTARLYAWVAQRDDVRAVRLGAKGGTIRCAVVGRTTRLSIELSDAIYDIDTELANDPETKSIDFHIMLFPAQFETMAEDWLKEWRHFGDA